MRASILRTVLTCTLLLSVTACLRSGRLPGQGYPAEGPPFVSERARPLAESAVSAAYRVILVGDTGEPSVSDPTLEAIGRWGNERPDRTTVVFLGDNVYPSGVQPDSYERDTRILQQQLEATEALKVFVPGNHDWGFSPSSQTGDAVLEQQKFILRWTESPADFLPRDACPGPGVRRLAQAGDGVTRGISLVAIDWTPFLSQADRLVCEDREFVDKLEAALTRLRDDFVIVASHYPIRTGGPHGGFSRGPFGDILLQFFWWSYGSLGDVDDADYAELREPIEGVLRRHPPLVYAAGHDHSLQLIEGEGLADLLIVSGAGSTDKVSTVTALVSSLFAHAHPGFVVVDFVERAGETHSVVRVVENGSVDPVFEMRLSRSGPASSAAQRLELNPQRLVQGATDGEALLEGDHGLGDLAAQQVRDSE